MGSGWASPSRSRTIAVMGVTTIVILAVSYIANRPAGGGSFTSVILAGHSTGPAPEVGKPAPDFTATTMQGERLTLSKLRGHPVWLTFGAPWCQPCRAENPDIENAYEKHRARGLIVVAVFIQDSRSDINEYAERTGLTYPRIADSDGKIASLYRIAGIPSHFFIDRSGVLRRVAITSLEPETIDQYLSQIGVDVGNTAG